MAEPRPFAPDEVARKEFGTGFRGFDQHEVRAFLGRLAAELAALQERERSLGERLADAERRAEPKVFEDELESALGVEAAKVLHAAREAATEIRTRAEEQVARMLREAGDDATRMREEASSVLADRTAEAERAAADIRSRAERDATAAHDEATAAAAATVESAKEEGRRMVGEAQAVRERILKDLGRRRRAAQQQLEQLRAGRDRLLEACRAVQGQLDDVVNGLDRSEPEARAAAESAGLRVEGEAEPTLEELEVEVAEAIRSGLVVVPPRGSGDADQQEAAEAEGEQAPAFQPGAAPGDEAGDEVEAQPPTTGDGRQDEPSVDLRVVEVPSEVTPPAPGPTSAPAPSRASLGAVPAVEEKPAGGRRRRRKGAAKGVGVVDLGGEEEGVRLLPAEPPAPPTEASADAIPGVWLSDDQGAPEPARGSGDEEGDEPALAVGAEAGAPADQAAAPSRGSSSPDGDPAADGSGAADDAGAGAGDTGAGGVDPQPGAATPAGADSVFARLRADRAAEVARAEAVLATDPPTTEVPSDQATTEVPADPAPLVEGLAADGEQAATDAPGTDGAPDGARIATAFEARDGALEPHERDLTRALKRALADEQNELLDALRTAKGVPGLEVLLPPDGGARWSAAARPALAAAAATGGGADLPDAEVDALATALADDLVGALRPRLERALDAGGGDQTAATEAVSGAYREWKTSRIEAIARHHAAAAWAEGSFASTPEGAITWVVDPEVGCSPDCADNALAGPTPRGEAFPTGHLHPPAHAGCRCLVQPPDQ